MAGIFSPDVNFNIQPESPVAPVQAPTSFLEGALSLGSNFLSAQESLNRSSSRGSSGSPDPNLAVFAEDIQKVEGVRQQFGDNAASLYEKRVAQKFAQYGVDFNADYKNVYQTTTGRSFDFYGKDNQTYVLESYQKDPRFKAYYLNSQLELPQGATEDQRFEYAVRSMSDSDFNAAEIQRVHNEANYKFTAKSEVAFNGVRKDFLTNIFALAQQREKDGGSITADDVENLVVQWSALKAGALGQPMGVSNNVFEGQRVKNAEVDAFVATLKETTSNPATLNRLARALSATVLKEGSVESAIVATSLLKDPTVVLSQLPPDRVTKLFTDVGKTPINWSEIVNGPPLTQQVRGTNGITLSATFQKIQTLSPPERGNTLNSASTVMQASDAKASAPSALAFADAAVAVGAAMGSGGSDTFLSPEFLRKNFASGNVKNNYTALSQRDPDTAAKVKDAWEYGLGTERVKQSQNLLALEKTITGAKWDGQKYILAFDNTQFRGDVVTQFNRLLDFTYQGDLSAAARDNFKQIISRNPGSGVTNILESGGLRYLPEALRRRESIAIIDDASNFLNPNLANDEVTTNAPVVGSPTAGEAAPANISIGGTVVQGAQPTAPDTVNVNKITRDPRTGEPIFPAQDELAVEVQNVLKNAGVPESPGLTDSIGKFLKDLLIPSAQAATPTPTPMPRPRPANAAARSPAISNTLNKEGGYQDDPDDPGNWTKPDFKGSNLGTNRGITPREWAKYKGVSVDSLTADDMKAITDAETYLFYEKRFKDFGVDKYPPEVQEQIFDLTTQHRGWRTIVKNAEKEGPLTNNNLVEARVAYIKGVVARTPELKSFEKGMIRRARSFYIPIPPDRPEDEPI